MLIFRRFYIFFKYLLNFLDSCAIMYAVKFLSISFFALIYKGFAHFCALFCHKKETASSIFLTQRKFSVFHNAKNSQKI